MIDLGISLILVKKSRGVSLEIHLFSSLWRPAEKFTPCRTKSLPVLIFAIFAIFPAIRKNTGSSPSSKYEHRRTSALYRNIRNIRICMGKKPIFSVTYENERISIRNSLPYLKCVLRLSCVVHGPILWPFYVFLCYLPI